MSSSMVFFVNGFACQHCHLDPQGVGAIEIAFQFEGGFFIIWSDY